MSAPTTAPPAIARQHRAGRARRSWQRLRRPLIALADAVVIVAVWEFVVTQLDVVKPVFLPPPSAVLDGAIDLWDTGKLMSNLALSAQNWSIGFSVGAVVGIALGLLLGSVVLINRLSMPLMWALWATPLVAIQPIITVWFGFGPMPIIVLVFISTFIPVALNTATGLSGVDLSLLRAGRVFGASRASLYWKVRLPWTLPYAIGGLRMAVPTSLIGLLVGEMVGSPTGLGALIVTSVARFRTAQAFAVVVVFVLLSVLLVNLFDGLERRIGQWRKAGSHD